MYHYAHAVAYLCCHDARHPSLASTLSCKPASTRDKTRCIHVTHAIDELNFLSTSSPNDNYTVASPRACRGDAGGAGPVTCLVSPLAPKTMMRCVFLTISSGSVRYPSAIFHNPLFFGMTGRLSWWTSLSFPGLSLNAPGCGPKKKSDEYHHAMPSSLSGPPSPSDRGLRCSSPQLISTWAALADCGLRPSQIRCAKTRPTSCGQHH
ncbi:hypothetical protein ACSS6W_004017 [Trichoderma asperelloides]